MSSNSSQQIKDFNNGIYKISDELKIDKFLDDWNKKIYKMPEWKLKRLDLKLRNFEKRKAKW